MTSPSPTTTLAEARAGFVTQLQRRECEESPPSLPQEDVYRLVRYPAPLGGSTAYVGPLIPQSVALRPAVVWLPGEFAHGVRSRWCERNDPAHLFTEAGLQVMIPGLRGGNDNPGVVEGFYGEVQDVVAAGERLAQTSGVDPQQIYLAGHCTGATLALLTAECSSRFCGIFALGPVDEIAHYGQEALPFDLAQEHEAALRSPIHWLHGIRSPTYLFEGASNSHHRCVEKMAAVNVNPAVFIHLLPNADHFSMVRPICHLLARKIREHQQSGAVITFTDEELAEAFQAHEEEGDDHTSAE